MATYATPFHYQLRILLKRAFQNVIRNPLATIGTVSIRTIFNVFFLPFEICFKEVLLQVVINCIFGLIFGLLFYQVDDTPTTGVQNRFTTNVC